MLSHDEMIGLQAGKHELVAADRFRSKEQYVLHLIHTKAYEQASELAKNKTVLDLGCNTGYGSQIVNQSCREIIGVDVSERAISTAKSLYGSCGIRFDLIDGKRLPFEDGKFDLVVSLQVIEHVVNYQEYISEIRRVLSPQGVVMFTTPNALLRLDPGMKPWNRFHVREFSPVELEDLLADFFADVSIYGLFAEEPLYSIEFNRLKRGRKNARKRQRKTRRFLRSLRSHIRGILPSLVADKTKIIRDALRKTRHRNMASALNVHFQKRHTTDDLCYRDTGLEHALDLLATCSKHEKNSKSWLQDGSKGMA